MDLAQQAIVSALSCKWERALELNKEILKSKPHDVDAINRIAKAYFELGDIQNAVTYTQMALKADPLNTIACKCLDKYKSTNSVKTIPLRNYSRQAFLEEPGKTKIVQLLHPGDKEVLVSLDSGEAVCLVVGRHRLSVTTEDGKYIGKLPDDLASRLIGLIRLGNEYQVYIKSSAGQEVRVFIKETKGVQSDLPSFPMEKRHFLETV